MKIETIRKFAPLYKSAKRGGADLILNRSLGLDEGTPVPLGISHGVDFGATRSAMDVSLPEPLHWAYNDIIMQQASPIKKSLKMPHPWWFATKNLEYQKGDGVLVVSAPPSKENDLRLIKLLRRNFAENSLTILVKDRGYLAEESKKFWSAEGYRVVTSGPQDSMFYHRLIEIIISHERMVCCTLSSAAFFAASVGKKVEFLEDYSYYAYEVAGYVSHLNFGSSSARTVARKFIKGDVAEQKKIAQNLLGFTNETLASMRDRYLKALSSLVQPLHNYTPLRHILATLALRIDRPGLLQHTPSTVFRRMFYPKAISEVETNEISIWLDGITEVNLKIFQAPYIKGVTEPGAAFDQLSHDRKTIFENIDR